MSLEKGTVLFQPGDTQYAQAFLALRRDGFDPSKFVYVVSIEDGRRRYLHKFRNILNGRSVEVEV